MFLWYRCVCRFAKRQGNLRGKYGSTKYPAVLTLLCFWWRRQAKGATNITCWLLVFPCWRYSFPLKADSFWDLRWTRPPRSFSIRAACSVQWSQFHDGWSHWRFEFSPMSVPVGFVRDEVENGQDIFRVLRFPNVSISQSSTTNAIRLNVATQNVVK